jgi:hypothetical protein
MGEETIKKGLQTAGCISLWSSPFFFSILFFQQPYNCIADHSRRAVQGMNSLHSLERWDRGFESRSRHGCLFVFILCLLSVAALQRADHSSNESYRMS